MKVLLGFFIVAAFCGFSTAQYDGSHRTQYHPEFALLTTEHVLKITTPLVLMTREICAAFPNICNDAKNITEQMRNCIDTLKTRNITVCSKLEQVNYDCAVDLKVYYEQKLPKSAESLPRLLRDSYMNSVRHVCKLQVNTFWELMDECIAIAHASISKITLNNYDDSRPTIKKAVQDHQYFVKEPTRARLCRIIESVKNHTEEELNTYCGNKLAAQAALDLFNAAVSPCKHNDSL